MSVKIFRKVIAIILALTSTFSFVACGGDITSESVSVEEEKKMRTLSISGGGGWLYDLKYAFEDIYEDVYINITSSHNYQNALAELTSGAGNNDLYFLFTHYYWYVDRTPVRIDGKMYDSYFADLSDVVNGPAYGETESIASKFVNGKMEWLTSSKGKVHAMLYSGGLLGFAVNKDILKQADCEIPVTTDEMFDCFEKIKEAGLTNEKGEKISPMNLTTSADNALRQPQLTWFAQYNGTQGWDNFWNGIDENGEYLQPSLLNNKGLLRSLEVAEKMAHSGNKYLHQDCLTDDEISQQSRLFNKECVFLLTGDWLLDEFDTSSIEEENLEDIIFVKYPLISSIVERLEDKNMSDETLAAIVREIDAGASSSTLCSTGDFAIIKDARSINLDNSNLNLAVVPCYSDNIELAKDFLRFVYSDIGIKAFANNSRGDCLMVNYDYEKNGVYLNNFKKSVVDVMRTSTNLNNYNMKHPLFAHNGLYYMNGDSNKFPIYFETQQAMDRKTAKEVFESNLLYIATHWDEYIKNVE